MLEKQKEPEETQGAHSPCKAHRHRPSLSRPPKHTGIEAEAAAAVAVVVVAHMDMRVRQQQPACCTARHTPAAAARWAAVDRGRAALGRLMTARTTQGAAGTLKEGSRSHLRRRARPQRGGGRAAVHRWQERAEWAAAAEGEGRQCNALRSSAARVGAVARVAAAAQVAARVEPEA